MSSEKEEWLRAVQEASSLGRAAVAGGVELVSRRDFVRRIRIGFVSSCLVGAATEFVRLGTLKTQCFSQALTIVRPGITVLCEVRARGHSPRLHALHVTYGSQDDRQVH